MDRGAWQDTVHGAIKSQTILNNSICTHAHLKMSYSGRVSALVFFICGFPKELFSFYFFSSFILKWYLFYKVWLSLYFWKKCLVTRGSGSSVNLSQCWPGAGMNYHTLSFNRALKLLFQGSEVLPLSILLRYALQDSFSKTNPLSPQSLLSISEQQKPALPLLTFFKPHSSPQCRVLRPDTVLYTMTWDAERQSLAFSN